MIFAWTGHVMPAPPSWATWRHDEYHTGNLVFEAIPPTNPTSLQSPSHTPGIWDSSREVEVAWSGAQDLHSGLAGYSVVWDTSPSTLPDTILDLGAEVETATSAPLADGDSYYFHLRTGDKAGNWTPMALHLGPFWVDGTPPASQASSPPVVTGAFSVTWSGSDATSGLAGYTIEVRDGAGPWTVWLDDPAGTSATYPGEVGHVYAFRSIARDAAGNVETAYTPAGDTSTAVARHLVRGAIYDQRERPMPGAAVNSLPEALNAPLTRSDGQYTLGLADGGVYDLAAYHCGCGGLPALQDLAVYGDVEGVDVYLPPATNLIQNGDFEGTGHWQAGGVVPPAPELGAGHTGDYALELGALPGNPQPPSPWTWTISQTATLPKDVSEATLDWVYRVAGDAQPGDELLVTVRGPSSEVSHLLALDAADWTHGWLDATEFAGQQVVVTFALTRQASAQPLTVWLDEVGLGAKALHRVFLPLVLRSP